MAEVSRVTVLWTAFPGAPGYTKFSFMPLADDTARNAAGAAVRAFFNTLKDWAPNGTTFTVQPNVDNLDIVTGELMSSIPMSTPPAPTVSAGPATAYAAGSGLLITWSSGGVFAGRRLRNRTYWVPALGVYETNGTLTAAAITDFQNAGIALMAASGADLAVWNRSWTKATPPEPTGGNLATATSCTVKDMATVLRSRRA